MLGVKGGSHSCDVAHEIEQASGERQLAGASTPHVEEDLRQPAAQRDDGNRAHLQNCAADSVSAQARVHLRTANHQHYRASSCLGREQAASAALHWRP